MDYGLKFDSNYLNWVHHVIFNNRQKYFSREVHSAVNELKVIKHFIGKYSAMTASDEMV